MRMIRVHIWDVDEDASQKQAWTEDRNSSPYNLLHNIFHMYQRTQADGFVDPSTQKVRRIPFEVMVRGDKTPVYEETLEDNGRFNEQPVLPFNAFGTMAMARGEFDTNSASSQVFFLLKVRSENLFLFGFSSYCLFIHSVYPT